jgi:bifunctional ADP-heptose synthase (sugar kinase/adenylyltransferase)
MKLDYCAIGHVCFDIIGKDRQDGGSSLYGSLLASQLNKNVKVITAASDSFDFQKYPQIQWQRLPSKHTTTFELIYKDDQRYLKLQNKAEPIKITMIDEFVRKSRVVMLSPVVDEFSSEMINLFSTQWIGLTPQGWFRDVDPQGFVKFTKSKFDQLPKKIKLIVVSEEDISNDKTAWQWIKQYAEIAVCTNGKKGYLLWSDGEEKHFSPMEVMQEKDPTGCGDIFSTAMLMLLANGFSPIKAAELAGQAAGLASTQSGLIASVEMAGKFLYSKFKA